MPTDFDPYTILHAQKKASKKYHKSSKGKAASRKSKLKIRYDLTVEEYELKVKQQQNKCIICNSEADEINVLCVDHAHDTGKVRDLLCITCNAGLGMFKENIENLANAISYLNKHRIL